MSFQDARNFQSISKRKVLEECCFRVCFSKTQLKKEEVIYVCIYYFIHKIKGVNGKRVSLRKLQLLSFME